jgi:hypothetical protein
MACSKTATKLTLRPRLITNGTAVPVLAMKGMAYKWAKAPQKEYIALLILNFATTW